MKDTFNELADEIANLRIQSYEKQIDLQETELKCVRLQIRPHFFLNAMTTISSLSQREKKAALIDMGMGRDSFGKNCEILDK